MRGGCEVLECCSVVVLAREGGRRGRKWDGGGSCWRGLSAMGIIFILFIS